MTEVLSNLSLAAAFFGLIFASWLTATRIREYLDRRKEEKADYEEDEKIDPEVDSDITKWLNDLKARDLDEKK